MEQPNFHTRKVRLYEFAYVVPWQQIVEEMKEK